MAVEWPVHIGHLMEGPLDIVGDVHGEIEVLERLMRTLGYDEEGIHAQGRRLVFLGDLIDRGPDSPAVLDKVIRLVRAGLAQCLMGNHELNALLNRPMHGNGWLIQPNPTEEPGEFSSARAEPDAVARYLQFFSELPLALENDELRVVHACWHAPSIARLRHAMRSGTSVVALYSQLEQEVSEKVNDVGLASILRQEKTVYGFQAHDADWEPQALPAHAEVDVIRQMHNSIRVLTTSSVQAASQPFFAAGAWRMIEYAKWWDSYADDIPVIIGHFWRLSRPESQRYSGIFGGDVFAGVPNHAWIGCRNNVYCVDYSVGQLHLERLRSPGAADFHGKLAALRYPEWEVHHDDGTIVAIR